MNIAFCTGWGVEKDGIADYSRHLCAALGNMGVGIEILKLGFYIGEEKYYRDLAQGRIKQMCATSSLIMCILTVNCHIEIGSWNLHETLRFRSL